MNLEETSKYFVRPLQSGDLDAIFPILREADKAELWAMYSACKSKKELLNCLKSSCEYANVYVCVSKISELPFCVFGCSEQNLNNSKLIFMFGTDELITLFKYQFLRTAKTWLKYLSVTHKFTVGVNIVHSKNTVHIKWLAKMGAVIEYQNPIKPQYSKETFYPFKLNLL